MFFTSSQANGDITLGGSYFLLLFYVFVFPFSVFRFYFLFLFSFCFRVALSPSSEWGVRVFSHVYSSCFSRKGRRQRCWLRTMTFRRWQTHSVFPSPLLVMIISLSSFLSLTFLLSLLRHMYVLFPFGLVILEKKTGSASRHTNFFLSLAMVLCGE